MSVSGLRNGGCWKEPALRVEQPGTAGGNGNRKPLRPLLLGPSRRKLMRRCSVPRGAKGPVRTPGPAWEVLSSRGSRALLSVSLCAILLPAPLHPEAGLASRPKCHWHEPSTHIARHGLGFPL